MAASIPERMPVHVCRQPPAVWMSALRMDITDLPMILLKVSPIPIGLMPGLPSLSSPLSSGISLAAISSCMDSGWMFSEQRRLAKLETASAK